MESVTRLAGGTALGLLLICAGIGVSTFTVFVVKTYRSAYAEIVPSAEALPPLTKTETQCVWHDAQLPTKYGEVKEIVDTVNGITYAVKVIDIDKRG